MLKPNEKFFINYFWCQTSACSFEHGEDLEMSSSWDDWDMNFDKSTGYDSVTDALADVCHANCFKFDKTAWVNYGIQCNDPDGLSRFESNFLVDETNAEASSNEIERWKKGEKRLWNCQVYVNLTIKTVGRGLSEDEAKNWQ